MPPPTHTMTAPLPSEGHLEPEQVVGYLENTLTAAGRRQVQAHLADCAECAAELVDVSRLRRASRPASSWLPVAAAAAAVIAVVLVGPRLAHRTSAAPEAPVRGAPGVAVSVVAPAEGEVIGGTPNFTWHAVPGATAYRITLSRADGDSVWAATVHDTTARPPASVALPARDLYYWYVDVLLADGRSVGGTAHQFRVHP
jgi:hypothetical protein